MAALTLGAASLLLLEIALWLPPPIPPACIPPPFNLPSSANAALSPHPRLQTSYSPSAHFASLPSPPSSPPHAPGCFSTPPACSSPPDYLRVLQWNAGGLRARSTELLHFLSSHPVDLICIQESNLNSSSSFWIPGFSAVRSDRTHSRSGIFSRDTTNACGVIIFVRQGLSELSASLSSFDPYFDCVGVNISCSHSLMLMLLLFALLRRMAKPIPFPPPFFLLSEVSSFWGDFKMRSPLWDLKGASHPVGKSILLGHLWPSLQRPWHTHSSPSFLWQSVLPWHLCSLLSWLLEVLQDLGFNHLSILLSVPLLPQRTSPLLQFSESSLG